MSMHRDYPAGYDPAGAYTFSDTWVMPLGLGAPSGKTVNEPARPSTPSREPNGSQATTQASSSAWATLRARAPRGAGVRDVGGAEARNDLHDARALDNGRDMVDERAAVEVAERTASRPVDGKAIAAATLAVLALAAAQWWIIGTVAALAAIAFALASRRAVRADPNLRGTTLGVLGFIVAVGVLVFATVGPSLVSLLLVTLAPPG